MKVINLVPAVLRAGVLVRYRLGIVYAAISLLLAIIGNALSARSTYEDIVVFYAIGLILSPAIIAMLYLGIRYKKVALAKVFMCNNELCVIDGWGEIWRRIPYSSISSITHEEMAGAFLGRDREEYTAEYICLYLNGFVWTENRQHDSAHYSKTYKIQDFLMIAYDEDAYKFLLSKAACH